SSRRQSYHSIRGDTKSCYQSSRSRGTEPAPKRHHDRKAYSRKGGRMSESEDSARGHWKSKSKNQRSSMEDEDLSQPWVCKETDPFTHRIRYFDLPKRIRMPSHVKMYDGSEDPWKMISKKRTKIEAKRTKPSMKRKEREAISLSQQAQETQRKDLTAYIKGKKTEDKTMNEE
ncbi:hypothetical protein Tco_0980123, partial [Tanacetum coccineum]